MGVYAVQAVRKMRGGSQPQLMLGADQKLWVVKFQNNPQHVRVLANEMIASGIAAAIGLTVPATDVVEVAPWLVENSAGLEFELGQGRRERCRPGLHFGSQWVGGPSSGHVVDLLPEQQLSDVSNLNEFAGMLCLDKWGANCDERQAVFSRGRNQGRYRATFVDHGFYFNAGEWNFPDAPLRATARRNEVYAKVTGWNSFEPWLHCIEEMEPSILYDIAETVPPEWYGGRRPDMEHLVDRLLARRSRVRDLILAFRDSDRTPFPLWPRTTAIAVPEGFVV